jgi:hypothetical protein
MSAPAAAMLLIDLENMIGNKARPGKFTARLDALSQLRSFGTWPLVDSARQSAVSEIVRECPLPWASDSSALRAG